MLTARVDSFGPEYAIAQRTAACVLGNAPGANLAAGMSYLVARKLVRASQYLAPRPCGRQPFLGAARQYPAFKLVVRRHDGETVVPLGGSGIDREIDDAESDTALIERAELV